MILELYNSKDLLKRIIYGGEIYEFNKEKNVLLVNNKKEFSLDDIKRIHIRTFRSSSGKDLYRLYMKTSERDNKLVCQNDNYEVICEPVTFINKYLTIPIIKNRITKTGLLLYQLLGLRKNGQCTKVYQILYKKIIYIVLMSICMLSDIADDIAEFIDVDIYIEG